jgi:hypothetical protein
LHVRTISAYARIQRPWKRGDAQTENRTYHISNYRMLHVDTDVHVPQVAENEEKTTWGRRVAEDKGRDAEEEHAGRPWPWKILSRLLGASPFSFAPPRRVVSPFFSSLAVRPDSGVQILNTRLPQRSFAGLRI